MKSGKYFFITTTFLILIIFFSYFLFFLLFLNEKWDANLANFGVFGDSFGVLTSLFSALTILGLIYTVNLQREDLLISHKELELTREELKGQKEEMKLQNETLSVQQFENTLFNMIDLFSKCKDNIRVKIYNDLLTGEEGIEYICRSCLYFEPQSGLDRIAINTKYQYVYTLYGTELEPYFRILYNIISFIDKSDIKNKEIYTNLVRGLLSRNEVYMLFYNCLSKYGEEKMKPLVIYYNLIKYIDKNYICKEHLDLLKEFVDN
jgi:hypothetical protein